MSYNPPLPPPPYIPGLSLHPTVRHLYVVIFEQKGILPFHDYTKFYTELYSQQGWFHFISNMWIVSKTETIPQLQEKLRAHIKTQDWLVIMPAVGPLGGSLAQEAWARTRPTLKGVNE